MRRVSEPNSRGRQMDRSRQRGASLADRVAGVARGAAVDGRLVVLDNRHVGRDVALARAAMKIAREVAAIASEREPFHARLARLLAERLEVLADQGVKHGPFRLAATPSTGRRARCCPGPLIVCQLLRVRSEAPSPPHAPARAAAPAPGTFLQQGSDSSAAWRGTHLPAASAGRVASGHSRPRHASCERAFELNPEPGRALIDPCPYPSLRATADVADCARPPGLKPSPASIPDG